MRRGPSHAHTTESYVAKLPRLHAHAAGVRCTGVFQDVYSTRRAVAYNKQQDKWERELAATDRTEQRYQAQRETGAGGTRRNKSSENYDIITLDYNRTQAGQVLQYKVRPTTAGVCCQKLVVCHTAHGSGHKAGAVLCMRDSTCLHARLHLHGPSSITASQPTVKSLQPRSRQKTNEWKTFCTYIHTTHLAHHPRTA